MAVFLAERLSERRLLKGLLLCLGCLIAAGLLMPASGLASDYDPVAAYSFDAGEGAVAEDPAGGHDATLEGAAWTKGKYGSALYFDNEESCASVPNSPELELGEEFTIETWIKPEGNGVDEPLISKETEGFFSYSLYLGLQESGKIEGLLGGEEEEIGPDVESDESLPLNVWSHIALTYDGARMRLYLNGEFQESTTAELGAFSSNGPLLFGCSEAFEDDYEGKLDEVRIYERALDGQDLSDIKAPSFWDPFDISVVHPPESAQPTVLLPGATDPLRGDGTPGSGVAHYTYRYSLDSEPFGPWHETSQWSFAIPGGVGGQIIKVEAFVTDKLSNQSGPRSAAAVIPEEEEFLEPSEQELPEEESEGDLETSVAFPDEEGELFLSGIPVVCETFFGWPHRSQHKPGRVNAVTEVSCKGGAVSGSVRTLLFFHDKIVADSGKRQFTGFKHKAYANTTCKNGTYHSYGIGSWLYPPGYTPKSATKTRFSPPRRVRCGG